MSHFGRPTWLLRCHRGGTLTIWYRGWGLEGSPVAERAVHLRPLWTGPEKKKGGKGGGEREPLSVGLREVLFCNVCALLDQLIKGTSFSVMLNPVRSAWKGQMPRPSPVCFGELCVACLFWELGRCHGQGLGVAGWGTCLLGCFAPPLSQRVPKGYSYKVM